MGFPQNIVAASILAWVTSFIVYKIYNTKHWLFKYMILINILYVIFLFTASLSSDFVNGFEANMFPTMFIIFYLLIFVPLFILVGYFSLQKVLSFEWDPRGLAYFIAVVWSFAIITLFLIALFIAGLYIFVYSFYGFAP